MFNIIAENINRMHGKVLARCSIVRVLGNLVDYKKTNLNFTSESMLLIMSV